MTETIIVAHRSLTPGAIENARSSLQLAADAGADLIELDVRLSLDRKPMVFHDAFLRLACAMICFRRWHRYAGFC